MSWNDAIERARFKEQQKKQSEEYHALGMTEEQIQAMYEYDLENYKSNRRYGEHTQQFTHRDFNEGEPDESESTLFKKFREKLSVNIENHIEHSRYWWIEELDDPQLVKKLKSLSANDLELLTLIVFDGYSQSELAKKMTVTQQALSKKWGRIKKLLK